MEKIEQDYCIDVEDGSEREVSNIIHQILKELEEEKTTKLESYLQAVINLVEKGEGGAEMRLDRSDSDESSDEDDDQKQENLNKDFKDKVKVKETEYDEDGF